MPRSQNRPRPDGLLRPHPRRSPSPPQAHLHTTAIPAFSPLLSPQSPPLFSFDPEVGPNDVSDDDPILIPQGPDSALPVSHDFELVNGFTFPDIPIDATILPDFPVNLRSFSPAPSSEGDSRRRNYEPWSTPSGLSDHSSFEVLPAEENTLYPAPESSARDSIASSTSTLSGSAHPLVTRGFTAPSPIPPSSVSLAARINNGLDSTPSDLWGDDSDGGFENASQSGVDSDSLAEDEAGQPEPSSGSLSEMIGQSAMSWTTLLDGPTPSSSIPTFLATGEGQAEEPNDGSVAGPASDGVLASGQSGGSARTSPLSPVGPSHIHHTWLPHRHREDDIPVPKTREDGATSSDELDLASFSPFQYRRLSYRHPPVSRTGMMEYPVPWFEGLSQTLGSRFDTRTSTALLSYPVSTRMFHIWPRRQLRLLFAGSYSQWKPCYQTIAFSLQQAVKYAFPRPGGLLAALENPSDNSFVVSCDFHLPQAENQDGLEGKATDGLHQVILSWPHHPSRVDEVVIVKENRFGLANAARLAQTLDYDIAVFRASKLAPPWTSALNDACRQRSIPTLRIALEPRDKYTPHLSKDDMRITICSIGNSPDTAGPEKKRKMDKSKRTSLAIDAGTLSNIPKSHLNHHLAHLQSPPDRPVWTLSRLGGISSVLVKLVAAFVLLVCLSGLRYSMWFYGKVLRVFNFCAAHMNGGPDRIRTRRLVAWSFAKTGACVLPILAALALWGTINQTHPGAYGSHPRVIPTHLQARLGTTCPEGSVAAKLQMCKPGLRPLGDRAVHHLGENNISSALVDFVQRPAEWDLENEWSAHTLSDSSFAFMCPDSLVQLSYGPLRATVFSSHDGHGDPGLANEDGQSGATSFSPALHLVAANFTVLPIHKGLSVVTVAPSHRGQKLVVKAWSRHHSDGENLLLLDLKSTETARSEVGKSPCRSCHDARWLLETLVDALAASPGHVNPTELGRRLSELLKSGQERVMTLDGIEDVKAVFRLWANKLSELQTRSDSGVLSWWADSGSRWKGQASQMAAEAISKASEFSHRAFEASPWTESENSSPNGMGRQAGKADGKAGRKPKGGRTSRPKIPKAAPGPSRFKPRKLVRGLFASKSEAKPRAFGMLECKGVGCKPGPTVRRAGKNARKLLKWARQ